MEKKKKEDKKSKLKKLARKGVTNRSGLAYAMKYTPVKREYSIFNQGRPMVGNPTYNFDLERARSIAERSGVDQFNYKETYNSPTVKYWTKKKGNFGSTPRTSRAY